MRPIALHGKLVLKESFHRQHRDLVHETYSAAKSLTATVVGTGLQRLGPKEALMRACVSSGTSNLVH